MTSFQNGIVIFLSVVIAFGLTQNLEKSNGIDPKDPVTKEFTDFITKNKLNINKNSKEFQTRLNNFQINKKIISDLSNQYKDATFALNQFATMSKEEFKNYMGAADLDVKSDRLKRSIFDETISTSIPTSFDFRSAGKVTPVKNQGGCGSCYAFATTAAVESQYLIRFNKSLDLAEQSIVNCFKNGAYGCNGGYTDATLDYIAKSGIPTEACLPYTMSNGVCSSKCNSTKYYAQGYRHFGFDESKYAAMLYNFGPAVMQFQVPPAFMFYSSGILDIPQAICSGQTMGYHAILLVGYTADYWIAKNSWGSAWGENGFVRFKRGQNFCGMTDQVISAYLKGPKTPEPACSTGGDGVNVFSDATKVYALEIANNKRSQIAKGQMKMRNGSYIPQGRNINKLVWNCTLENFVQQYVDTCSPPKNPSTPGVVFQLLTTTQSNISLNDFVKSGIENFYTPLGNYKVIKTNGISYVVTDDAYARFGQYADADATSFACTFKKQSCFGAVLFCAISSSIEDNDLTAPIFEVGAPCTQNSHCTKPGYKFCDISLGLCSSTALPNTTTTKAPSTTTTTKPLTTKATTKLPTTTTKTTTKPPTTTTKITTKLPSSTVKPIGGCSEGDGIHTMNNAARERLLYHANDLRSLIVKGMARMNQFYSATGSNAPPAKNMKKLIYNCSIESIVQELANSNCLHPIDQFSIPGLFFNSFHGNVGDTRPLNESIMMGIDAAFWLTGNITVAQQNGISVAIAQTDQKWKFYAPFLYGDAVSIACAVGLCSQTPTVYCGVSPAYTYGSVLYDIGAPCTQDSHCTKPGYNKCDITFGLCYP